jgi:hypothetical protein
VQTTDFHEWEIEFKTGILMRLVTTAIRSRQAPELLNSQLLQNLWRRHNPSYQLPLLYLTSNTPSPWSATPRPTGSDRRDCLSWYYAGMNQLSAKHFEDADTDLRHAWHLSKSAKDARGGIVLALSLSAFLSHVSEPVFLARISRKWLAQATYTKALWSFEAVQTLPPMYRHFKDEIQAEKFRRQLIDLTRTVTKVDRERLKILCGEDCLAIAEELKGKGLLEFEVNEDVVEFHLPKFQARLEGMIAEFRGDEFKPPELEIETETE